MRRAAGCLKQRGFTLVEVLVALAILSIALSALLWTSSETSRNLFYLRDKTIAHWVAMNVTAEARLGLLALPASPGLKKEEAKALGAEWMWQANVEKTKVENILRINVQVGNKKHPQLITAIGFVRGTLP